MYYIILYCIILYIVYYIILYIYIIIYITQYIQWCACKWITRLWMVVGTCSCQAGGSAEALWSRLPWPSWRHHSCVHLRPCSRDWQSWIFKIRKKGCGDVRCIGTLLLNDTKCNYWMLLNHIEEKDCTRVQRRESRGEDGMSMQEADPAGVTKALESLAAGMEPDASLAAEHTWLKRGFYMDLLCFTPLWCVWKKKAMLKNGQEGK